MTLFSTRVNARGFKIVAAELICHWGIAEEVVLEILSYKAKE